MREMEKQLIKVPYLSQSPRYPTGCESVSSVMLLQHLGYEITVDEWIKQYLEQQEFETKDGIIYGGNPRKVFCGNPYREDGMGCYAPVICKTLDRVFSDKVSVTGSSFQAVDETGTSMTKLRKKYIDRGMPVVFWACIDMKEPVTGPDWQLADEPEKTFTWISNEHCMLLVGYDEIGYYFNDPYENHGVIRYEKELVEQRHKAQYAMAVGVKNIQKQDEFTANTSN